MKTHQNRRFITTCLILAVAVIAIPGTGMAQRFSHPSFGGSRPAAPPRPMTMPVSRPAAPPPQRQVSPPPRPVSTPPRTVSPAPVRQQEVRSAPAEPVADNRTINGGGRNIGNHDFHPVVPPHEDRNVQSVVDRSHPRGQAPNVYHTGGYRGMHPYYYHPFRPSYWGPNWHPLGFFLSSLAADAVLFSIGNQQYYYEDGCYYEPSNGGYTVVPPPVGAIVASLPQGYETTMVGNDTFYYYGGAFYIDSDQGYQVVAAPPGAVITQLPVGAVEQQVNGENLLVYNNVYYQPISQDGQDAYQVIQLN